MFGKALQLELSGIDLNGGDELHPLADSAHDVPPIGSPSGQQDHIHFPADISGLRSDILGDVEDKGLHPDLSPDITILSPADNLLEVIRPEERHGTAFAHQLLLYLRFGIFTAVAKVNQLETRTRADSLRGERPVSSDSVVGINHLSVPVKSDGDPAADMGDNGGDVILDMPVIFQIAPDDSP